MQSRQSWIFLLRRYATLEGVGLTHKVVRSVKEQIKNWDEVEAALRATPMYHYLEESTQV